MKKITDVVKPVLRPERVLQFGEGNFLRAFADWMIDIANEKTGFNGSVAAVKPREGEMSGAFRGQQGLYTTVIRGVREGKTVTEFRAVTSLSRCISAYTQYDEFMDCAENPDLRFVISNTTEAGIAYNGEDRPDDRPQRSLYFQKKGMLPPAITFSLAALIAFYRGKGPERGELQGRRNGEPYSIKDEEGILRRFAALYAEDPVEPGAARKIVHAVLAAEDWWGEDLLALPGLEDAVTGYFTAIWKRGVRSVLEQLVAGQAG
jgi:mannitol-1-phosphate/altronate dehydrogenase